MRIISGKFKGRRFNPPLKKCITRPTMDIAKEGLFNILANEYFFDDIKVLDLFGGTGSISLEFISRGCTDVSYIDSSHICIKFINEVKQQLEIQDSFNIIKSDVLRYIKSTTDNYDIIFADPPYDYKFTPNIPDIILTGNLLSPNGLLILEHDKRHDFSDNERCVKSKKYGTNIFSFFK
ncbi:MAG TPA: methyltransferase domain-containing protein [Bacteroidetes bacterium]|nr:methyltransferase domain-containing protein [Bacteroidota bacterium]